MCCRVGLSFYDYYVTTIYHVPEFLIGMILGYIMHNMSENIQISIKVKLISYVGWIISFAMIYNIFYCNQPFNLFSLNVYRTVYRSIWAISLCWIVFACQKLQTGGILRWFLSLTMWQPLSKIGFSLYLFHRVYLFSTTSWNVKNKMFGEYYTIFLAVTDIVITTVLGLLFHLIIEAPISRILTIVWRKTEIKTTESKKVLVEASKLSKVSCLWKNSLKNITL